MKMASQNVNVAIVGLGFGPDWQSLDRALIEGDEHVVHMAKKAEHEVGLCSVTPLPAFTLA